MAPPQVDMNKKTNEKDLVPVETGTTVAGKRLLARRRCKKIVIGVVIGVSIVVVALVTLFLVRRFHHRGRDGHHDWDDDSSSSEEYMPEESKRLIITARDHEGQPITLEAVLDFDMQMAGLKDEAEGRCYVDRLVEDYKKGHDKKRRHRRRSQEHRPRAVQMMEPAMRLEVLRYIAGENIFRFCTNMPSYWVVEVPDDDTGNNSTDIIYL